MTAVMPLIRADQISPHGAGVILTVFGAGFVIAAIIVASFAFWAWWRR